MQPNYRVTKPAGSSLLIESRTPSDDTVGVVVEDIPNPINDAAPEVGGALGQGQGEAGVGADPAVAEAAPQVANDADDNGAGPGLQDQDSDQVDNHHEDDSVGDGVVVVGGGGGGHPADPGHSLHARQGVRIRARLTEWDRACGGSGGRCGRCVRRRYFQN